MTPARPPRAAHGAPPRVVLVTRPTELQALLRQHGTREQARFFLGTRGQGIEPVEEAHARVVDAVRRVESAVPVEWRSARIDRSDLERFVFEPRDLVVAVGQDGLVANVAKYLEGQPVVGINPDAERFDGVLVRHGPAQAERLLEACALGRAEIELRSMVEAVLDDGQRLLALNEAFVGHRSHQSARYRIAFGGHEERHSSSGLIVSTGTGATGWAQSISRDRHSDLPLPSPTDRSLAFFVREAWPGTWTGRDITEGLLGEGDELTLTSEQESGGVVFGDGIETDPIALSWGASLRLRLAGERLALVV